MRLLAKFSIVYALVFGLGLGAAGYLAREHLRRSAREQVLHQAQVMMEMALAMRKYTTQQVGPVVARLQGAAAPTAVPRVFHPQTVPAYAATEMFNELRQRYPDYMYKEAALNPTNPRDRAADWEEDIVKVFRNREDVEFFDGERLTPFGPSLFVARPMRAGKTCLVCHSVPAEAPAEMVALYGPANGFGWKENEVIAAQIVSVPTSLPGGIADQAFRRLMIALGAVAGATLLLLDAVLYLVVIRPVSRYAALADELSRGNLEVPELPVRGRDEVSVLAAAFNRMRRSLVTALQMLEKP